MPLVLTSTKWNYLSEDEHIVGRNIKEVIVYSN